MNEIVNKFLLKGNQFMPEGIKYLMCAINLFSKYAWVIPLKDKRGISIVNAFQKIISEGRKPNKLWDDQDSEFYNNFFKNLLKINNIEMCQNAIKGNLLLLRDLLGH